MQQNFGLRTSLLDFVPYCPYFLTSMSYWSTLGHNINPWSMDMDIDDTDNPLDSWNQANQANQDQEGRVFQTVPLSTVDAQANIPPSSLDRHGVLHQQDNVRGQPTTVEREALLAPQANTPSSNQDHEGGVFPTVSTVDASYSRPFSSPSDQQEVEQEIFPQQGNVANIEREVPLIPEATQYSKVPENSSSTSQKVAHRFQNRTESNKRPTISTPARKRVEYLTASNRELFLERRKYKANIMMLKNELAQANLQLLQRQQMEQNTEEEMEVEKELAGVDALKNEIVAWMGGLSQVSAQQLEQQKEKQRELEKTEQLLNRQSAEIQRLLSLLSLQQTASASNNPGLSTNSAPSPSHAGVSGLSSITDSSANANPSHIAASPGNVGASSTRHNSNPDEGASSTRTESAAHSGPSSSFTETASSSGAHPTSASFGSPSTQSTCTSQTPHTSSTDAFGPTPNNIIHIITPRNNPHFISTAERRARNNKQDNLAVPQRMVQKTELSFHIAPAGEPAPSPHTGVDDLLMQMNAAAENMDLSNTEHTRTIVGFMRKLLQKMGNKDIWLEEKPRDRRFKSGRNPQHLAWESAVREIWKNLYSISYANDFMMYQSADPQEVARFEEGIGKGPDDRLQLALHNKNSRWNQVITSKIVQSIQYTRNTDPQKWNLPDVTEKYILALVINQVIEARRAYSLAEPKIIRGVDGSVRCETEEEVENRIHIYYHGSGDEPGRWKKVEGRMLRNQKHRRCLNTARECASKGGRSAETWQKMEDAFERLGVNGESDEEKTVLTIDGTTVEAFEVLKSPWRAEEFDVFAAALDKEFLWQKNLSLNKKGGHSLPRRRVTKESQRSPPTGLPRSFYNPHWLEKQNEYTLEKLKISVENFPLGILKST
ncbi:hypothetical protein GYMLUDRAFT_64585 [Collybiopsis luxurians FD-317 M1]|uniref:Uncharacterized protein n=1 Tax=Collybiopsis luxurians FD-317 M1 TaxID=944289 RepID=A0A0D0ANK9_9AGAR|nr:hypothetical protein GYMLUDRAFT_64585 [Collybiopsis luxurians FD-317 M1]